MEIFDIKYRTVGGKDTDFIIFWARSISEAIELFKGHEMEIGGVKFNYSEHSIISIEVGKKVDK